ncbi:MAG: DUF6885 family protein [Elainellaceae cyanobacterium]
MSSLPIQSFKEKICQYRDIYLALLSGSQTIQSEHWQTGQQPDNLCGPYWAAILLRAIARVNTTPSEIGKWSGTILPTGDAKQWLPLGADSRQDYTTPLLTTIHLHESGTSAGGLAAAVKQCSANRYRFIPVQCQWSADKIRQLFWLCHQHPKWNIVPVCNLNTGYLWGANLPISEAIAHLNGMPITPPPPDWAVGHFVVLAGILHTSHRSLALMQDTYPTLGWQGYHLQPWEAIAAGLARDGQSQGGILLFAATHDQSEIEAQLQDAGFEITLWDNGTPRYLIE